MSKRTFSPCWVACVLLTFPSTASMLNDLGFGEWRVRIAVVLARDGPSVTLERNGGGRLQRQEIAHRQHDGGERRIRVDRERTGGRGGVSTQVRAADYRCLMGCTRMERRPKCGILKEMGREIVGERRE